MIQLNFSSQDKIPPNYQVVRHNGTSLSCASTKKGSWKMYIIYGVICYIQARVKLFWMPFLTVWNSKNKCFNCILLHFIRIYILKMLMDLKGLKIIWKQRLTKQCDLCGKMAYSFIHPPTGRLRSCPVMMLIPRGLWTMRLNRKEIKEPLWVRRATSLSIRWWAQLPCRRGCFKMTAK